MSIPAQRIRQLRAMFAQAKKRYSATLKRSDMTSAYSRYGTGELSAHIDARPNILRRLKDFRSGRDPQLIVHYPYTTINSSGDNTIMRFSKNDIERLRNTAKSGRWVHGEGNTRTFGMKNKSSRAFFNIDMTVSRMAQRKAQRRLYRAMRKSE